MKFIHKPSWYCCFATLLILKIFPLHAFQTTDTLELDSSIVHGKLSNGLSYYIKPTHDTSSKINIRLVVRVGHNQEVAGQSEFAHLTEHLGLSAGKHISTKKSSRLFDEVGIKLGQINGHTFNDYTDYMVITSNKNVRAINTAFQFFQDIIWNLELTKENIDKERLAVLNELYGGQFSLPALSNFLEKEITGWGTVPPENYKNHINSFKPDSIIGFYDKWYRPEFMSVIVVGNITDVEKLEKDIVRKFSKKTSSTYSNYTFPFRDYLDEQPKFIQKEYKTKAGSIVEKAVFYHLYIRQNPITENGTASLKAAVIRELFLKMLNGRFKEKQNVYNSTYNVRARFLSPPLALSIHIASSADRDETIIKEVYGTLIQIQRLGFTQEEFNKYKQEHLLSLSQVDTSGANYWMHELIKHAVNKSPMPSGKQRTLGNLSVQLTLEEFNVEIKKFLDEFPKDIAVLAPTGHRALSYSENTIRGWLREVATAPISPYQPPTVTDVLMQPEVLHNLKQNTYTQRKIKIPGTKEYVLENGIRLVLDPYVAGSAPTNGSRSISFQGYIGKGVNCFPKKDAFSAINAPNIVENAGVGGLDKFELDAYLKEIGFKGNVAPYIAYNEAGIKGSVSLEHLETALQLVYLYFTQPNTNTAAFEDWVRNKTSYVADYVPNLNREELINEIREIFPDPNFTVKGTKALLGVSRTNHNRAMDIFREIFVNEGGFTFLFTGDFHEQEMLNLCNTYLGNLPFKNDSPFECEQELTGTWKIPDNFKLKTLAPSTLLETDLIRLLYITEMDKTFDWKEEIRIGLLRRALSEIILRSLRTESQEGGIYDGGATVNLVKLHKYVEMGIRLSCLPEDSDRIIMESKQVVTALTTSPIDPALFQKLKMGLLSSISDVESNSERLSKVKEEYDTGITGPSNKEKKTFISSLTTSEILKTAKRFLNSEPYIFKMTTLPEMEN